MGRRPARKSLGVSERLLVLFLCYSTRPNTVLDTLLDFSSPSNLFVVSV
jgi:hypothetical protein